MKPAPFRYHAPTTLAETLTLLATLDNAKPLAGGQSLVPMLNMRFATPDHLIDLNGVSELVGVETTDDWLQIGAMTRQRDVEFSSAIAEACPLLSEAVKCIGHRQTRNRGTIGGSLCNLDPSAELVCVCAALDAIVEVAGPQGPRMVDFADFPLAYMTTVVQPDEILVKVRLPRWPRETGSAFVEFARRHGDFAIVSAAAMVGLDADGRVERTALALGGVNVAPVRMYEIEKALLGTQPSEERIRSACQACRTVDALGDPYASAAYRQHLAVVISCRALSRAVTRAAVRPPEADKGN